MVDDVCDRAMRGELGDRLTVEEVAWLAAGATLSSGKRQVKFEEACEYLQQQRRWGKLPVERVERLEVVPGQCRVFRSYSDNPRDPHYVSPGNRKPGESGEYLVVHQVMGAGELPVGGEPLIKKLAIEVVRAASVAAIVGGLKDEKGQVPEPLKAWLDAHVAKAERLKVAKEAAAAQKRVPRNELGKGYVFKKRSTGEEVDFGRTFRQLTDHGHLKLQGANGYDLGEVKVAAEKEGFDLVARDAPPRALRGSVFSGGN